VLRRVGWVVAFSSALASVGLAQTTGTPIFLAPYRPFQRIEFGGSISDPGPGVAVEGFYRFAGKQYDVGFRAGLQDARGSDTHFLAGVDFRTRIVDHTMDFPLDGAFTAGLGASFGGGVTQAYIPVGVSLGRRVALEDSNAEFVPYIHPVLVPTFGDGDSDLRFALGVGVDIAFNRRFELRISGALGDIEGVGVSLAITR